MIKSFTSLALLVAFCSCTQNKGKIDITGVELNPKVVNTDLFFETQRDIADTQFFEFQTKDKTEQLRVFIRNLELDKAKKIILQKSFDIKSLYADQKVPYFGQLTKNITCKEAVEINNPLQEDENQLSLQLNLMATETLVYGSCISDQDIFKSQLLYLYCKKNNTLYEFKYFYPKNMSFKIQLANCHK